MMNRECPQLNLGKRADCWNILRFKQLEIIIVRNRPKLVRKKRAFLSTRKVIFMIILDICGL